MRYEVDEQRRAASGRDRARRHLHAAPRRPRPRDDAQARPDRARVEPILHADYPDLFDRPQSRRKDFLYVNPTGKFVIGGPMGDTGPDRPEDHRRHLRRRRAPRRRRLLRQGPDQGRPLGRLRGALRREERRRRRSRRPLPDPGRLRDRRRAPDERARRLLRHREDRASTRVAGARARALRPAARRDHPRPRPAQADLPDAPRRTATSAATSTASPGSAPTRRTRSARRGL